MNPAHLILLAVALFMLAAFITGYTAAETKERKAHDQLRTTIRNIEQQKRSLTTWVRENWPNEFDAYRRGHQEGYQQGVLHSPFLEGWGADE